MKTLFIGDIVGRVGRETVGALLPGLRERHGIDLVVANCENAAGGLGITERTVREILNAGVDLLTTGDHTFDRKEAPEVLERESRIVRPANYPPGTPGRGSTTLDIDGEVTVGLMSLQGRTFMGALDCPFRAGLVVADRLGETTPIIICDFHAEATSEKIALTYHLAGRVTAVLGTHTHVQTADERIVAGHTAAITDAGMTGPSDSVIGMKKSVALDRFLKARPRRYEIGDGTGVLNGVLLEIDTRSGAAVSIERLKAEHMGSGESA
ncbi:MAG: metallophosphoesterase [Candidatus Eisenbacteria bacterium]|nr:metallophosphoesterase [Candidatus Eisenbacteria bacterium]